MPNYNLSPNNPEFYTAGTKWGDFTTIWSKNFAPDSKALPKEYEAYLKNPQNFRAFAVKNLPPRQVDASQRPENVNIKVPGYNPDMPSDQQRTRRELSNVAFEKAMVLSYIKQRITRGYSSNNRQDYIFLRMEEHDNVRKLNEKEWNIRQNGTPEEKGAQVERRMRESLELFNKCMEGISDDEVVNRLEEMHACQDMVSNAQLLLEEADKGEINLSDETRKILQRMEKHSPLVDFYMKRARVILNPLYEFVDIDKLLEMTEDEVVDMAEMAGDQGAKLVQDLLEPIVSAIADRNIEKRVALHDLILEDFNVNAHRPTVQLIKRDNTMSKTLLDMDGKKNDLDRDYDYSYVLVTSTDNTFACYKINKNATVERASVEDMQQDFLNNLRNDVSTAFKAVKDANKGFFIGSRAYSKALKAMNQVDKAVKKLGDPPTEEQLRNIKALLDDAATKCDAYLKSKDPENFTKNRERNRYSAMQKALNACKKSSAFYDLQLDALSVQKGLSNPALDPEVEKNRYDSKTCDKYLDFNYKKHFVVATDVGLVADQLKAEIYNDLHEALIQSKNEDRDFDPELGRLGMAKAVVLEMMLASRHVENGTLIAGEVEVQYAANSKGVVDSVLNNPRFQAMTENLTRDKLYGLVTSGDAKTFVKMLKNSQQVVQKEPEVPVAQKENEGPVATG